MAKTERLSPKSADRDAQRLKASIADLLKRRDLISMTARALEHVNPLIDRQRIEVEITDRLSPVLLQLTRLIEADDDTVRTALQDVAEEERATILGIREAFEPFKTAVQAANLFDQGYVNRVTGVRYRPYVFLLSNIPTVDVTLRSFDRNVLRFADTIDNVMRVAVGVLRGVSDSYQRARSLGVPIPEEIAKRCESFVEEALSLLEPMKEQMADGGEKTTRSEPARKSRGVGH